MDTLNGLLPNYSTIDVTDVNKTLPASSLGLCQGVNDSFALVRYFSDVIFNVPISIVGLVGNSLAFLVLLHHEPRLGTTLLLQTLAITDNIVLIERLFLYTLPTIDSCHKFQLAYRDQYGHIFRWLFPSVYFLRMLEAWLVVFVTIERWLCVTYPHRAKEMCARGRVAVGVVMLTGVSLIVSLPRFFEFKVTEGGRNYTTRAHVGTAAYTFVYRISAFFLFNYLLPMSVLAVLNVQLYRALKKHELWLSGVRKIRLAKMASRALTTIVVAVVMMFIVCNVPPMTAQLIWSLEYSFHIKSPSQAELNARKLLSIVSNVFVTLNCSVNFIIYAVGNSNFRRTLLRLCRVDRSRIMGLSGGRGRKSSSPSATQNMMLQIQRGGDDVTREHLAQHRKSDVMLLNNSGTTIATGTNSSTFSTRTSPLL